nr:hypothetical protein [Tanacetum cinerariifolium]
CKQEEGQSVSSYVLNMKSYIDNLEHLGQPGKIVNELHAMLKLHEQMLPKKDVAPALHAIRARRVQKMKRRNRTRLLRGIKGKGKPRWDMHLCRRHLMLLNSRILHHPKRRILRRTRSATNTVKWYNTPIFETTQRSTYGCYFIA